MPYKNIGPKGVGPMNHSTTAVKIMKTYTHTLKVFCLIRFCVITIGVCHVFGGNVKSYISIISTQRSLILFTSTSTLKYS